MLERIRRIAESARGEMSFYKRVLRDTRTPTLCKVLLALAVGYLMLPFDLIPDCIPLLGHLDDVIIVSILLILALKMMPPDVIRDCRNVTRDV